MRLLLLLALLLPTPALADAGDSAADPWEGPAPAETLVGHVHVLVKDRRPDTELDADLMADVAEASLRAEGVWAWRSLDDWDLRLGVVLHEFGCGRTRCGAVFDVYARWREGLRTDLGRFEWVTGDESDDPLRSLLDHMAHALREGIRDQRLRGGVLAVDRSLAPHVGQDAREVTIATLSGADGEEHVTWTGRAGDGFCVADAGGLRVVAPESLGRLTLQSVSSEHLGPNRWWTLAEVDDATRLGVLFARTAHGPISWFPGARSLRFTPWATSSIGPVAPSSGPDCTEPDAVDDAEVLGQVSFSRARSSAPPEGPWVRRIEIVRRPSDEPERQVLEVRVQVERILSRTLVRVAVNPTGASWLEYRLKHRGDGLYSGQFEIDDGTLYLAAIAADLDWTDHMGTRTQPLRIRFDPPKRVAPMR